MDLKTGRIRRKAVFGGEGDESGDGDTEDDEEMSEGDRLKNSSSDETEEEEDAEMTGEVYMADNGVKRQRLEVEEDTEIDLPAFADSDDDLERSSEDEGEVEEADESSEDEGSTAEEEGDILQSKMTEKGSKPCLLQSNGLSHSLNLEKKMKKAALTFSDSGHCAAEEAFASEDESEESSSLSAEEKGSENEEVIRKKSPKPSQVAIGQKQGSEDLTDETSDIEDLLKEEDYKEENNYSTETSGMLKFNFTAVISLALKCSTNRMSAFEDLLIWILTVQMLYLMEGFQNE